MQTTKVFHNIVDSVANNRITVAYGGSSSGKTFSMLQLLALLAIHREE